MMKWLFPALMVLTSLRADAIDPDDLSNIYTEAVLFVAVFALMSIISFIISRKHARQYDQKNPFSKQSSPEKPEEPAEEISADPAAADTNEIERLVELSKLLKDGLLTKEEFQILKQKLIS